jgi:hypothetical protein
MRNVSENIVEEIKIHILCSVTSFSKNCVVYEKFLKNSVAPDKPQVTTLHGACVLHVG